MSPWPWVALAVAGLVAMVVLYLFSPTHHPFYPRCWFHAVTGWLCPGCGGLRATHNLLHGRIEEAFRLNPLFVGFLPVAILAVTVKLLRPSWRLSWPAPLGVPLWVWLLFGVTLVFGVVRNLP